MTHLVVPLAVQSAASTLVQAQLARQGGADAVELRVDAVADQIEMLKGLVAQLPLPCIVTCRHACETGGFDGPEAARIALYAALAASPKPPLGLDVEWVKWKAAPEWAKALAPWLDAPGNPSPGRPKLILSSHDFGGRPDDLADRLARMLEEPLCGVPKLAWKAQGLEDCALALRLLKYGAVGGKPGVALAMGEAGMPSRILAKKAGAFMTFAALDKDGGTAPGQPLLADMVGLYRWNDIKPTTKVYGVVGCPVGHSMSPAIHNAGFAAVGFDGVYVPMRIEAGHENFARDLDAWIGSKEMDFGGASVTIPHKENLLRWARERGGEVMTEAEMIGAANTLSFIHHSSKQAWIPFVSNTDCEAIVEAIVVALGGQCKASGLRGAVVGAGGAARAALQALMHMCDSIVVFNRSLSRAQELAFNRRVTAQTLDALVAANFDILINCTPLGMAPNVDVSPLFDNHPALAPGVAVFDTVYNPIETKLLKQAKAAGCICIHGTEMFVRQAAAQFQRWTGQDAPRELFRRILAEKLGA